MSNNEERLMREECPNCGSTSAFQEFEKDYYCHKCSFRKSKSKTFMPEKKLSSLGITYDSTKWTDDLSTEALSLLFKNRITDELIKKYNIKYDPNFYFKGAYFGPRLIFPYYVGETLEFFEAKSLGHKVKYISYPNKHQMFVPEFGTKLFKSLVLVEDIQSCIRVNETTPCAALRGTSLSDTNLQLILFLHSVHKFDTIKLWLDGDEAGKKAMRKLQQRLSMFFNIELIQTDKDPKKYSDEEIKEWTSKK